MSIFDELSFELFYKEVFPQVRAFLFSKCRDIDIAEDLAQESFIRLWNNRAKIESAKARSYAFTVGNNLFLDHTRHQKVVQNFHQVRYINDRDIKDPQYLIEEDEFHKRLNNTIHSMPDGVREVFMMSRMEKMKYQQIADSLDLSVKTIEKRMQKALEILSTLKYKI
jgi:RNA polymerase sigma-70 factor (family 1)